MLDPEIATKIEDGLREVSAGDIGTITSERRLDELGLDSVSMAELIVLLEDTLDVTLENDEIAELETFGDLGALIKQRQGG